MKGGRGTGVYLLTEISYSIISIKTHVSNYIHVKQLDMITLQCYNYKHGLIKPPLNLWHEWVMIFHKKSIDAVTYPCPNPC